MENYPITANDIISLVCEIIVIIKALLIYRRIRGKGWPLLIMAWFYMIALRIIWIIASFTGNTSFQAKSGSYTFPHWVLIAIALFIFDEDIKKILKR